MKYSFVANSFKFLNFFSYLHMLGINVPRRRFLPVKTCSDLLIIMSNLYEMKHGRLEMSPQRQFPSVPIVQLSGSHFKKVREQLCSEGLRLRLRTRVTVY